MFRDSRSEPFYLLRNGNYINGPAIANYFADYFESVYVDNAKDLKMSIVLMA